MDKAVPSRILELMGIDCLTRHNIASHLQKYRSHQKHLRGKQKQQAGTKEDKFMEGAREILPLTQPYCHPQHQLVPNALTPGTPCFPPTHASPRFPSPPVPGIPPHAMYKVDLGIAVPSVESHPRPPFDFHADKSGAECG